MEAAVSIQELLSAIERKFGGKLPREHRFLEIHGAIPPLGAAVAAHIARTQPGSVLYVVPDEAEVEARRCALSSSFSATSTATTIHWHRRLSWNCPRQKAA